MGYQVKIVLLVLITGLVVGLGLAGCDKSETNKAQNATANVEETMVCPVMPDKKIDKKFFVDHEGMRIYLCCDTCVSVFKKNPERYIQKAYELGITFEKVSGKAP